MYLSTFLHGAALGGAGLLFGAALAPCATSQQPAQSTAWQATQNDPDPSTAVSTAAGPADPAFAHGEIAATWPSTPPVPMPDDLLVPVHTAAPDMGIAYGVWAAGPGYKISFHDGATFVPLLGASYPHNQPWRWRTTSVRVGERELVAHEPRLSYDGLRAEYDLGAVVEAYELRQGGVEQTFVIASRPAGSGDLVVRGEVTSMLNAAAVEAAHQGLSFVDDHGTELVRYGAATAVDANGRTCAMSTAFVDGTITLRLPASWLAQAAFPLVVDPLLGPGALLTGDPREEIDIVRASEFATDAVWMVYSTYASASDLDVYFRRWDDAGGATALAFTDVTASWSTRRPRCTYSAGANRGVAVFERYFPLSDQNLLRYHVHDHSDLAVNTNYWTIPTTDNAWRADVGGAAWGASGTMALVVWQQEANSGGGFQNSSGSTVQGALLNVLTTTLGPTQQIAGSQFTDNERPSVNQFSFGSTTNNFWMVAYQTISTLVIGGSDDWDIGVRQFGQDGSLSATHFVDNGSSDHKLGPMIEGTGDDYVVAFASSTQAQQPGKPSGINGHEVRAVRLNWVNGMGHESYGTTLVQAYVDARAEVNGLAFDRDTDSHWAVVFRSTATDNLYLRTLGYQAKQLHVDTLFTAGADSTARAAVSYDEINQMFVFGYGVNGATNYVTTDRWDYPAVAAAFASGTGCSPATITWVGSQQIGSENGYIRVYNAAPDSIHLMVMATAPVSALLVGIPPIQDGCWLLVPNVGVDFVGFLDLQLGNSVFWSLPLPEFLTTDTFYFQDFHTVGGGLFEFVSTQRLTLPIVK